MRRSRNPIFDNVNESIDIKNESNIINSNSTPKSTITTIIFYLSYYICSTILNVVIDTNNIMLDSIADSTYHIDRRLYYIILKKNCH